MSALRDRHTLVAMFYSPANMIFRKRVCCLVAVAATLMSLEAQPASPPVSTNKVSVPSETNATVIPLSQVAIQAESAESTLQTIEAQLSADASVRTVEEDL